MNRYILLFTILLMYTYNSSFAQSMNKRESLAILDSINLSKCQKKALFSGYITRGKFDFMTSLYRSRENNDFRLASFTYGIYLPFQLDLNYLNRKAKDKLMKINSLFFIHHSSFGNYGIGLGVRLSFLLVRKFYINFQTGVGWFDTAGGNIDVNDGLTKSGLNFLHVLSFSYNISDQWSVLAHILHVSNGGLVGKIGEGNLHDAFGLGVSYQIKSN